jgi:hypothetical protein
MVDIEGAAVLYTAAFITAVPVIPAKLVPACFKWGAGIPIRTGIQIRIGFRVKPGMT